MSPKHHRAHLCRKWKCLLVGKLHIHKKNLFRWFSGANLISDGGGPSVLSGCSVSFLKALTLLSSVYDVHWYTFQYSGRTAQEVKYGSGGPFQGNVSTNDGWATWQNLSTSSEKGWGDSLGRGQLTLQWSHLWNGKHGCRVETPAGHSLWESEPQSLNTLHSLQLLPHQITHYLKLPQTSGKQFICWLPKKPRPTPQQWRGRLSKGEHGDSLQSPTRYHV